MQNEVRALLTDAAERGIRYLEQIDNRKVFPTSEALENLRKLDEPMPDLPMDPGAVLALLDEIGSPGTVATTGGRYFGFVVGGALPVTVGAHWLADAWDQNAGLRALSPVAAKIEEVALRWVFEILGLPPACGGAFVTGAQMANFTCLAAARHAVLKRVGWDVEREGLYGAPPITVIVGEEVHVTVLKALALLGLGTNRVIRVRVDQQGRMRADALPPIHGPTIVCAQAGNVNTGSFDPVGDICAATREFNAWVHVDGAFGLWAAAASERKYLVQGIESADSWTTDGHKWLNVPQDSGIAIVREPIHLRAAMAITAAYLNPGADREPCQWGPDASRRARGVEIWAALRSLGRQGLEALVERCCQQAATFAARLQAAGFEILNEVVLNQVLVSFGTPAETQRIICELQADGTCWCGGTVWQGRTAMRISVSSWATSDADVERSLAVILRIASGTKTSSSSSS